jgi:hypothetical protein
MPVPYSRIYWRYTTTTLSRDRNQCRGHLPRCFAVGQSMAFVTTVELPLLMLF